MSNLAIAFDNLLDTATLSGGAWATGLPLGNLKTPQPSEVARTTDTAEASTTLDCDLGSQQLVKIVALIHHNASLFAKWRVRVGTDDTFATTLYDSGSVDLWAAQEPFGTSAWSVFSWGSKLDAADSADFRPISFVWISDTGVIADQIRIEVFDTTNVHGFFEAGRCYVSSAYQPTFNPSYGLNLEFVDPSTKSRSRGGQVYVDVKPKYRRMNLNFELLSTHEALNTVQEIDRLRGKNGDLLAILDPEDTNHAMREALYCQFQETGGIEYSRFNDHRVNWILEEML